MRFVFFILKHLKRHIKQMFALLRYKEVKTEILKLQSQTGKRSLTTRSHEFFQSVYNEDMKVDRNGAFTFLECFVLRQVKLNSEKEVCKGALLLLYSHYIVSSETVQNI